MFLGLHGPFTAAQTNSEVRPTCSIRVIASEIPVQLPLSVRIVCESSEPTEIDLGENNLGNLRFAVTPAGSTNEYRQLNLPSFTSPGKIRLQPGEPFEQRVNLGELQLGGSPSKLLITAKIVGTNGKPDYLTNTVEVSRVQAPEAAVKEDCEKIRRLIQRTASFSERSELVSELAGVTDPVAVQSLAMLLGARLGIDNQIIDALERFGTEDSRAILSAYATNATDVSDARHARSALSRMSHHAK